MNSFIFGFCKVEEKLLFVRHCFLIQHTIFDERKSNKTLTDRLKNSVSSSDVLLKGHVYVYYSLHE